MCLVGLSRSRKVCLLEREGLDIVCLEGKLLDVGEGSCVSRRGLGAVRCVRGCVCGLYTVPPAVR